MTAIKPTPLPLRNDTLLGVCEGIGEDFGFNPLWLRLAFIAPLFVAPVATVVVYLLLGAVVAVSRYAYPHASAPVAVQESAAPEAADEREELPIAA